MVVAVVVEEGLLLGGAVGLLSVVEVSAAAHLRLLLAVEGSFIAIRMVKHLLTFTDTVEGSVVVAAEEEEDSRRTDRSHVIMT